MKKTFFILITIFFVLSACTSQQESKKLLEEKCIQCHSLEKSLSKNKSLAEWKRTIETMARYSDGAISKKDIEKIAKYLAERNENN
jgi:nitrate/TMAO reductase-like tetraheme cytochrome c subunit